MLSIRFLALIAVSAVSVAQAQDLALPLWEVGAVGGLLSTPAYPGSSDKTSLATALPYVVYRGDVLRVDRGGLGARLVNKDDLEVDVGFAGSLPASSGNIAARAGMEDLSTLVEFGPRAKVTLADLGHDSHLRFELAYRTVLALGGGVYGKGSVIEPKLSFEARDIGDGWRLSTALGLVYADKALGDYLYGVPAPMATAARPTYEASAGLLATRWSIDTAKSLNPNVRVLGYVRYESYAGAANADSPLMRQSSGVSVGLAFAWVIGRSDALERAE